ncbi:hypothetical protein ACA910_004868 [Epithemia clementina (nom. ined.)]
MTLIREIRDRAACGAWSPIQSRPDLVALGTKDSGAAGFEDTGGELEIYDFGFAGSNLNVIGHGGETAVQRIGSIRTASRFSSVAWTLYTGAQQQYSLGLIAGGMVDGMVHLWDVSALLEGNEGRILSLPTNSKGPIKALSFNSLEPSHLAVGGSNGTSWVIDLSSSNPQLQEPSPGHAQKAEITAIAWNSQVAHIVATAAADGSVTVWDLKGHKAWCELRAEAGQAVADLVWNPKQGLHLLTASADDRNPVIKVWDLAASTSMPVQQMSGHQGGILQISWCPHDDTLLLTTSKDTRTLLWDLRTLQPIAELPNESAEEASSSEAAAAHSNPSALFAQASSFGQKHMRYQVSWSPLKRGVALTCSLDRKVQAHSILSLATRAGRPPAWMKPSSTVIGTAFGGTFLTCAKNGTTVIVSTVTEQPLLVTRSRNLEKELETLSIGDFCRLQQQEHQLVKNSTEANIWGFLRVLFETNARQALLEHLGFKDGGDFGLSGHGDGPDVAQESINGGSTSPNTSSTMSLKEQNLVQRALVVGNFEAAVETCFQTGNLADALLLASCGGAELWAKAQQRYFESSSRPYLSIVRAVIRNQLDELIQERDPSCWQETLAMLSTYGASEQFPNLCILLGNRLDECGDAASASLCYMCALSLDDTVKFWKEQLKQGKKTARSNGSAIHDANSGPIDLTSLHQFVIKVHVFLQAIATSDSKNNDLSDETAQYFFHYAKALAEQGCFSTAAKYCRGSSTEALILKDRLYRCRASHECLAAMGGSPPEFPYAMVTVLPSRGQVWAQQQREAENYQKQQEAYRKEQEEQRRRAMQQQQQPQHHAEPPYSHQTTQSAPQDQGDILPPGWVALQDPGSGRTYYANQTTGESSWDKPQMPMSQPQYAPMSQPQYLSQESLANSSSHSTPASKKETLASKYGDGFVSSASDPKLAFQYGNVGTGNPYGGAERPGTAAAATAAIVGKEQPPISATPNLDQLPLQEDVVSIRDSFFSIIEALKADPSVSPTDKRQLSEAEKAITILIKKLARGAISDELKGSISSMAIYLVNCDFPNASMIQTALVNSDWKNQKDWLKGAKLLIQLASKKLYPTQTYSGY